MTSALAEFGIASPEHVHVCTERFCATAKAYGFRGYGDTGYWSRRIKELAVIATEYLTGVGFACDPVVNAVIADERRAIVSATRAYAFRGYGDGDYWSDRCKQLAALLFGVARKLDRSVNQALREDTHHHPLQRTSLDHRVMTFVGIARQYACRGSGDSDFWSRRIKALALEVGIFAAKMAATVGTDAAVEHRQVVQRMITSAKAYAHNGYGDAEYWRRRCEDLCTATCEEALMLAVHS
jgi:hypothetical protein